MIKRETGDSRNERRPNVPNSSNNLEIGSIQQAQTIIKLLKLELKQKDQLIAELKDVISELTKPPAPSYIPDEQIPTSSSSLSNFQRSTTSSQFDEQIDDPTVEAIPETNQQIPIDQFINIKPEIIGHSNLPQPLKSKKTQPLKKKRRAAWYKKKQQCKECKEVKPFYCMEMCKPCYSRVQNRKRIKTMGQCEHCGELKKLVSGQTCVTCYRRKNPQVKKHAECKQCKNVRPIKCYDLCATCYIKSRPKQICAACGDLEPIYAKNMCHECYKLNKPESACQACGKFGIIKAKNMCTACYSKETKNRRCSVGGVNKRESAVETNNLTVTESILEQAISSINNKSKVECIDID